MPYYPKSQIKTNLFATANDYLTTSTNQPKDFFNTPLENIPSLIYKGPYYQISSGKIYTGKFPGDGNNLELFSIDKQNLLFDFYPDEETINDTIDINTSLTELDYFTLNSNFNGLPYKRSLPNFTPGKPTPQETQEGVFRRYFCKKNNEIKYLEIDKATYDKLSQRDPQIAWDLYSPTSILWLFKGNKELIYTSNKSQTESVERRLKWHGFSQYFQGKFLKYYLES